jgi:hypothetical protein
MRSQFALRTMGVGLAALLLVSAPAAVEAAYTSTVVGTVATMTGDASGDTLTITQSGGLFQHNRATAGDPGFNSDFDFDSATAGDQTIASASGTININAGDGNDTIALGDGINVRGAVDGGLGTDTIDYSASTASIFANLGLGTTGLSATLGANQENPPTTHTATGTATVSNYDIVTHTFDITVTVTGLLPADVTGFHIHRGAVGVNGPIIVDFTGVAPLVPAGTGFTFTATGLTLPSVNEAALLGGGTYVNVHTAAFPGGAIRGQLFTNGNVNLATGAATGTTSVTNIENAIGGTLADSLVGSFVANTLSGGAGADWIVGAPGADTMNGDAGADVLVWSNGDGSDVNEGGADADIVQVNGSVAGADVFTVAANGARIDFDRTNVGLFSLDIGTVETLTVNGIGGNDSFTINDLTGVTTLTTINQNGFDGDDAFVYVATTSGALTFNVNGGPGTDTVQGPNGAATWNVTAANLGNITGLVTAFRFVEALTGGTGSDTFNVKSFATAGVTVTGGAGADTLNYDAEGRVVTGDTSPPDGTISSPGVQSVPFTQVETVNVSNPAPTPPTGTDVDGDRKTDLIVFRPTASTWFALSSSSNFNTNASTATTLGQPGDVIVPGDYDADGKVDFAVFRPATGTWHVMQSTTSTVVMYTLGAGKDVPAPGDYDGDRKTDPAVYRPSSGDWLVLTSSSNYVTTRSFTLGQKTDIAVQADYDGDTLTDVAVFHPQTGTWSILTSSSNFTVTNTVQFGLDIDVPVPADYDGDGRADVAVWRPVNGVWFILNSNNGTPTEVSTQWGLTGDVPVPSDYDGDAKADLAVWRPSVGTWFVIPSTTPTTPVTYQWGLNGDVPLPNVAVVNASAIARRTVANSMRTADLDGDGRADLNVYRPSNGTWFNLQSKTNFDPNQSRTFQWGLNGDIPVSSDYDGDGITDVAVWRPSSGVWFILLSSSNYLNSLVFQFGLTGDIPVVGDYDGDGRADVAVYRPVNGLWFVLTSSTGYSAETSFQWGLQGDVPVPGDYDGDGKTDRAVWRPSTGQYLLLTSGSNFATFVTFNLGASGDVTVPGDYDGDGKTDGAVYRPSTGVWTIRSSRTSTTTSYQFGLAGDIPAPTDFEGDGRTDLIVWRPASGLWFIAHSTTGFSTADVYQWGLNGDIPILPRQ